MAMEDCVTHDDVGCWRIHAHGKGGSAHEHLQTQFSKVFCQLLLLAQTYAAMEGGDQLSSVRDVTDLRGQLLGIRFTINKHDQTPIGAPTNLLGKIQDKPVLVRIQNQLTA